MNHTVKLVMAATLLFAFCACTTAAAEDLANGFAAPAESVRPWCYWWWLNGYVTREGIVRDLDEMRAKGIHGVLVFHAGGGPTPKRTEFMSPEWRTLFRFAVEEAARRNLVVGLNLCDGWNAGGPWVKPEDAAKTLVFSTLRVTGPKNFSGTLPKADKADQTYRDTMVLAWQVGGPSSEDRKSSCLSQTWVDLTAKMSSDGRFAWQAPTGEWLIVRFGYETRARTSCTGGGSYWEIDPLSAEALDRHFAATAGVLVQDVEPYVGKTWRYVHIDSGEIGNPEWTRKLAADFRRLRGYDPLPYFAAKAGEIVDDPAITERFLEDYDRTIGDLMIEGYYGHLGQLARQHGLATHSEAAGYQKPTVDALRSMGCNDIAMSEFWSRQSPSETNLYIHQLASAQLRHHDGIKNAASAAHIYGRQIAQAEAFTVIRDLTARPHSAYPNWDGDLFALKAIGDRAFCAGANRMVLCHFIHQPEPDDQAPGYVWPGVGVEFSRKVTWWPLIHGWLSYLTRCQRLLQEGRFVADACYFQGEWVPAYVPAKWAMDPPLPPGFDCDMINAEALVTRSAAGPHGRLVLPDGQSYRYLVLWQGGRWQHPPPQIFNKASDPSTRATCPGAGSARPLALSPATLKKLKELVEGGVTLVGPRPDRAIGLAGYPTIDVEVKKLTDELWGPESAPAGQRKVSKGRVVWGQSLAQVMQADGLRPDLEIVEDPATAALPTQTLSGIPNPGSFDSIHRTLDNAEVYFIANLRDAEAAGKFTFRVDGKQPELWDPLTGAIRDAAAFQAAAGRTTVPLEFAPRGSLFVVFRRPIAADAAGNAKSNFPRPSAFQEITGAWTVRFDPKWGGPASVKFDRLEDWTKRPEPGIIYYSGKATYMKTFDVPASACQPGKRLWLDLGKVKNVAEVRLNGRSFGGVWTAPWRAELTGGVQPSGNRLEIDVANLWPNRLIGDAKLPPEKRLTKANVAFKPNQSLLESGLLGPVTLQAAMTTIPDKP